MNSLNEAFDKKLSPTVQSPAQPWKMQHVFYLNFTNYKTWISDVLELLSELRTAGIYETP